MFRAHDRFEWGLSDWRRPQNIFWAARITTLANNPRLEHIKSWIRTFPAHFFVLAKLNICVCTLLHGQMYPQKKMPVLQHGRALTHNCWIWPIISYLWMVGLVMRLFSCGANLGRSSACIQPKKAQPLGIYFWHLRLGLFKSPFLVGEAVDFFKDKCMFSKKNSVLDFGRALALTQNSWICPIISYLWMVGLVMRLFSCGANLWRSSAGIQPKKGPAPWNLFLTPAPRPLQVTFFGWWSSTYVVVAFCKDKCMFSKKTCVLHFGRAFTQHYWICPIMSYLWMVGLVMRLFSCGANLWRSSACIQPKKVQPLGIYFWHLRLGLFKSPFLVGEAEHMWL